MDTLRTMDSFLHCRRRALGLLLAGCLASLSGCSLFVMAGKMFFGDPQMTSPFKMASGVDLAKSGGRVVVICTTPESTKMEFPSLDYDLQEGLIQRLRRRKIDVIDPDSVASYLDDNGGDWSDRVALAEHFGADYIIHVNLDSFSFRELDSANLFRGRATGEVFGYAYRRGERGVSCPEVFHSDFSSVFPQSHPISDSQLSAKVFSKQYLDRVATQLAQLLHDHRLSELIE